MEPATYGTLVTHYGFGERETQGGGHVIRCPSTKSFWLNTGWRRSELISNKLFGKVALKSHSKPVRYAPISSSYHGGHNSHKWFHPGIYCTSLAFTQGYTVRHWLTPRDIPYITGLHPGIYRTSLAYTQGYTVRHWLTPRDILYVTSGWSTDRFLSRHSSQRPFVKLFMNWRWIKIVRLYTTSTLDWNKIFVQFLSKLFRFQTAIFTATHPETRGNFWWLFRDSLDILSCLDLRSIIVQRTSMKIFHVDNVDRWWTLPIWIQHTGAVTITTTKFSKTSADFEIVDSMIWAPQQNSHRHFHFSQPVNVTVRTLYHSQSMIWSLG